MDAYVYVEKANLVLMNGESVREYEQALRTKINEELVQFKTPYPGGGASSIYIQYLFSDKAIIEVYTQGTEKYYEVPYKRDSKGAFTLGKPVAVQERKTFVPVPVQKAVWTTAFINKLPDSAFLYIESGGKKDADGKTVPRGLRHFPYKDDQGKIDLPHLRNAIARIPQSKIPGMTSDKLQSLQEKAQGILEKENARLERESKRDKKKAMEAAGFEAIPSSLWSGLPV